MSRRNTLEAKAARRARKQITRGTVPAYIDLIAYVRARTNCTAGTARKVLMSGALRVDSHPVGFTREKGDVKVLAPLLDAKHRGNIQVVDPT